MQRKYFALDLHNNPDLIALYEYWHRPENIWPDIVESIRSAGITHLDIFRTGDRLIMIMETDESFSADAKAHADANNQKVQEWEELMWQFQKPLPHAAKGQKWVEMKSIFCLDHC